jgi:hypothetical protein
MSVAGNDQRLIQLGETAVRNNENVAFVRTDVRRQAEREQLESQQLTPAERELERRKQIAAAYAESHRREQEQKASERARLIKEGKIRINPDGSETHYMQGNRY